MRGYGLFVAYPSFEQENTIPPVAIPIVLFALINPFDVAETNVCADVSLEIPTSISVSYTHLTLPTICSV